MSKLAQVKEIVIRVLSHDTANARSWCPKDDADAEKLVDNCIEGDFNVQTEWPQALERFAEYFKCYSEAMDEESAAYRAVYE